MNPWLELENQFPQNLQKNVPLKDLTTTQVGGPAKYLYTAKTQADLINILKFATENNIPYLVIGGGSNLLVADQGVDLLVIKNSVFGINSHPGPDSHPNQKNSHSNQSSNVILSENSEGSLDSSADLQNDQIVVQSGTPLQNLVNFTIGNGLAGINKLTGIPGTLAGAVYGNAGAYGQTVSDHLTEVKIFDGHQIRTLSKSDCGFAYRTSNFKLPKSLWPKDVVLVSSRISSSLSLRAEGQDPNFIAIRQSPEKQSRHPEASPHSHPEASPHSHPEASPHSHPEAPSEGSSPSEPTTSHPGLVSGSRDSSPSAQNDKVTILEVAFSLPKSDPKILAQEAEDTLSQRQLRWPTGIKCPGSFFKNVLVNSIPPETLQKIPPDKIVYGKIPAGYLLEMVGAKGKRHGGAQVAPYHGNAFINVATATAQDYWNLAHEYSQKVYEKFAIHLEPEVQLINLPPL